MSPGADPTALDAARARIRELEAQLEESDETLAAIRRGDFDAVVVEGPNQERLVYTLENADRPYRVLIEQIQEGAFTLGSDGALLYCNPRVAAMLAHPPEALIGQPLDAFVHEADRPVLTRLLAHADRNGAARGELCLRSGTGSNLPANLSLSRLSRGDGVALLCGVLTDLTEQRQHLHELAEANAQLKQQGEERERIEEALRQAQKMEAIGQLTGGIAHDFNNLLTIIRSSVDFLRRPDLPNERRQRYMDAVSDTVDRAAKLTGQLLAFARRQALRPETFEVGACLRDVADMLDTITGARICVVLEIVEPACFVRCDRSQFETTLVNMAVNARDAMDGEGVLTLRLDNHRPMPVIRGHAGSGMAFVAVSLSDTGTGMPEDHLTRIFEPFFTTKAVGKGTGLGLSQVFGFAKQSGGDVDVESAIGAGTTFTLYLPQVEGVAGAPVAARTAGVAMRGTGQRILVVEDNIEVGRFATQILEDLGYASSWVATAEDALDRLGADGGGFDAVFSDVVMPGMGGVALAEKLRARLPSLPVILASGYSHVLARDADHGFELLHKPYSAEQLSRMLRQVIDGVCGPDGKTKGSTR